MKLEFEKKKGYKLDVSNNFHPTREQPQVWPVQARRPHLPRGDGVAIKPVPFSRTNRRGHVPTKSSESMAATSSAALFSVLPLPTATPVSARAGSSLCRPTRSAAAVSPIRCSAASPDLSPGAPAPAPPKPQIELEFVGVRPRPRFPPLTPASRRRGLIDFLCCSCSLSRAPTGRTRWTGRRR